MYHRAIVTLSLCINNDQHFKAYLTAGEYVAADGRNVWGHPSDTGGYTWMQDGKNIGFKLKALRGESLLKKLSFEPNDIFTAVNGVSLKNPFEALDALKSLTTAASISVTFMRNGAEQTQDFKL